MLKNEKCSPRLHHACATVSSLSCRVSFQFHSSSWPEGTTFPFARRLFRSATRPNSTTFPQAVPSRNLDQSNLQSHSPWDLPWVAMEEGTTEPGSFSRSSSFVSPPQKKLIWFGSRHLFLEVEGNTFWSGEFMQVGFEEWVALVRKRNGKASSCGRLGLRSTARYRHFVSLFSSCNPVIHWWRKNSSFPCSATQLDVDLINFFLYNSPSDALSRR